MRTRGIAVLVCFLIATALLYGGDITGTITDPNGKPLAGIFVSAYNPSAGMMTTVVTNDRGEYAILHLAPAKYNIIAKQVGFVTGATKNRDGRIPRQTAHLTLHRATAIEDQLPSSSFMSLAPEGEAKRFMAVACMGCHQFTGQIIEKDGKRLTKGEWTTSFNKMLTMFGPASGFPIIPPVKDVEGQAEWMAKHLNGEKRFDEKNIPAPISGDAAKVIYTEYDMPESHDLPHDLMVQQDGKVVVTGMFTHTMLELDPSTGKFEKYPIPEKSAGPRALEIDGDGTWWVLLGNSRKIGRFSKSDKQWKMYDIREYPHSIGKDVQGNLWFNGHFSKDPEVIGRLNPASGELKWFEVPSANMTAEQGGPIPYELRVGPDGIIWGGELAGNRIFRFDPGTEQFKVYTIPTTHSGPRRFDIAPDGLLWIPEYGGNNLTTFDPATETFKQYPYPTSSALPYVVRVNRQTGIIWIATAGSDEVAKFDPKTEKFTVYRLPTQVAMIRHMDIDPRTGAVWVAYASVPPVHPKVARIESF